MLDSMLSVGLSSSLTTALHKLAIYIPAFKKEIADGLLKILSVILMRQGGDSVNLYFEPKNTP